MSVLNVSGGCTTSSVLESYTIHVPLAICKTNKHDIYESIITNDPSDTKERLTNVHILCDDCA